MMSKKDINSLIDNIHKDFKDASRKEIDQIYNELKEMLKKYDDDSFSKNVKDFLKRGFTFDKRKRCELVFKDIIESLDNPSFVKREELRKDLLELSNIHRSFLENLIALIENS